MKAKVSGYPSGPVVAFGGHEFVSYEWRGVPSGCKDQARAHPYLEVLEEKSQPEAAPAPEPKAAPKPKPKPRRKTTTRRKTAKAKDAE